MSARALVVVAATLALGTSLGACRSEDIPPPELYRDLEGRARLPDAFVFDTPSADVAPEAGPDVADVTDADVTDADVTDVDVTAADATDATEPADAPDAD